MENLRFRALWALIAAADEGSTNRAARVLNITQPAVSHAIRLVEEQMGVPLFNRRANGITLTEHGEILYQRIRRAMEHLMAAEEEISRLAASASAKEKVRGLHRRVTRHQLVALISISERRNVQYASQETGQSPSIIWHALRELRMLIGEPVIERRQSGITMSATGEILVRYAKLALAELRHANDDLSAHQGNLTGRVIVGALPLSRTILVPRAIAHMSVRHPDLEFSLVEGPYRTLLSALRCGDIDLIVGALRCPAPADDVLEETLFRESLCVATGADNPLANETHLTLKDLTNERWVVPVRGTPTRSIFENLFINAGATPPGKLIESSSLIATRALLVESNYLTIISRSQIHYEEKFGILMPLAVEGLSDTERPIGVTTRAGGSMPPGVREFIRRLHVVSRKLYGPQRARRNGMLQRAV